VKRPNLNELTVSRLVPLLQSREIKAADLIDCCLDRIEAREGAVGAWTFLDADAVRRAAAELDRGPIQGVLHGVPIAVKDIIDTVDMPTECGSRIFSGRRPKRDAECIARIRESGGLLMGKSVTTELGYFYPGKTANPNNLRHTPGGSSSGSAAAVADFMVPAALGAQTAGSVTRPAAYCGVVGFKSTRGSIGLDGVLGLAGSLDSLGWFVREVEDAEVLRAALRGETYQPLDEIVVGRPKIAVCETDDWSFAQRAARTTLHGTARRLAACGAEVSFLPTPEELRGLSEVHRTVMAYEAAQSMQSTLTMFDAQLSAQFKELLAAGFRINLETYQAARQRALVALTIFEEMLETFDAFMAPSATGEAPVGLDATGDPIFSRSWTLLQAPSIAIPTGTGDHGLPVGVQLIGRINGDRELLQIAKWVKSCISNAGLSSATA
jgi:Asp-tRNA(Asn)/Glu-tRNA(Gln) amidotransferase A subunit family amidase